MWENDQLIGYWLNYQFDPNDSGFEADESQPRFGPVNLNEVILQG